MPRPRNVPALSFWEQLRAFPPIFVRLAGRRRTAGKNVAALSHQEIAIASGIRLGRVMAISFLLSWDDVTISEAEAFCRACGVDPTCAADRKRQREYIRICQKKHPERPPHYLRSSPWWQTQYLPLIQHLKSETTSSIASRPSPSLETKSAA